MGKLSNLPSDILLDIFTRLPTELVLESKLVCKRWRNLISDPSFSQMHLSHLTANHGKFTFLTLTNKQFQYFEYNEKDDDETLRITRINISPPFDGYGIISSCNGLICLSAYHDPRLLDYQPAYICNPITKECVILPKFNRGRTRNNEVYSGFGYLPSSNEYKVVRINKPCGRPNFESVEVYTVGSGNGWRNVGEYGLSFSVGTFRNDYGVFANETLHWITMDGKIAAFNLADEKFYELPTLPSLAPSDNKYRFSDIEVFGEFLCLSIDDTRTTRTKFWLLKKNGNQNMAEQEEHQSLTWIEEFTSVDVKPLAFMKTGELLCYNYIDFYSFDIKSSRYRKLVKFRQYGCQIAHSGTIRPHMNTLISLKALGEEDTKTMELGKSATLCEQKKKRR